MNKWIKFRRWLKLERIKTVVNFLEGTVATWRLSVDNQILIITHNNATQFLKATQDRNGIRCYRDVCKVEIEQIEWNTILSALYNTGELRNVK